MKVLEVLLDFTENVTRWNGKLGNSEGNCETDFLSLHFFEKFMAMTNMLECFHSRRKVIVFHFEFFHFQIISPHGNILLVGLCCKVVGIL